MKRTLTLITSTILTVSSIGIMTAMPAFAADSAAETASTAAETTADNTDGTAADIDAATPITSGEDLTLEKICNAATPAKVAEAKGIFSISTTYANTGDDLLDGCTVKDVFYYDNGIYHINEIYDYSDGYISTIYCSSDESDPYLYLSSTEENGVYEAEDGTVDDILNNPFTGTYAENATLVSVEKDGDNYIATIEMTNDDNTEKQTVTVEAATGNILKAESVYESADSEEDTVCTYSFDYTEDQSIDFSPKENNDTPATEESSDEDTSAAGKTLTFSTTDINGEAVTEDILKSAKLVLINYWEPWCGPCVNELPELEKLYENYKDQGLLVIGVYSSIQNESDAKAIVESDGITYPILNCDDGFAAYAEDYVPSTIFTDENGNILTDEADIGAKSYEDWEELIKSFGLLG